MSHQPHGTSPQQPETILQFGTGKFLRAFVDLFCQEINDSGGEAGPVVAVQSTGAQRARQLTQQQGRYHVAIRGLEHGRPVDRLVRVESIRRALAAETDWQEVLAVARSASLRAIVSNMTEAGYVLDPADLTGEEVPPRSFPAKLLTVLQARWEAGLSGPTILPCELLEGNAARLRALVLQQWTTRRLPDDFGQWIRDACSWQDTLVDRIVAAPRTDEPLTDPLLAVAEPFALWLIQGPLENIRGILSSSHPSIRTVDSLEPYFLRKVRILNGAHTALVAKALPRGFTTVRQAVSDAEIGGWLRELLFEEVVPVLEGRTEAPEEFATQVLTRFLNPFLEHQLADIAIAHDRKLQTRLVPTWEEYRQRFGRTPPRLEEALAH